MKRTPEIIFKKKSIKPSYIYNIALYGDYISYFETIVIDMNYDQIGLIDIYV